MCQDFVGHQIDHFGLIGEALVGEARLDVVHAREWDLGTARPLVSHQQLHGHVVQVHADGDTLPNLTSQQRLQIN